MKRAQTVRQVFDIDMASATDARTHTIAAADFEAGLHRGVGIYRALCGAEVLAAAMVSRPGPRCPACLRARATGGGEAARQARSD